MPLEEDPVDECLQEPVSQEVPSTAPWTDTGVDVTAGQHLAITAEGTVRYGEDEKQVTDADGGHYTGKKFYAAAVLPSTTIVSLIGKVGGTAEVGSGTLLFGGPPAEGPGFVGSSFDAVVKESGRLFLGFNDQVETFGDNSGAFSVTITASCEP